MSAYIKVLQRIGKVKRFTPSSFEGIDESISFCLDVNSNGTQFLLYDLTGAIVERYRNAGASQKKIRSIIDKSEGVLRAEIRLTKPKAIRTYTDETDVAVQLAELIKNSQDIFLGIFTCIVPFGDFYKKEKAVEIIQIAVTDRLLRRRMLHLLMLIPEKKSLLLDSPPASDVLPSDGISYYRFEADGQVPPLEYTYLCKLFSNSCFQKYGCLNVSTLTLEKLSQSPLLYAISSFVREVDFYVYQLNFRRPQQVTVKYLHWF